MVYKSLCYILKTNHNVGTPSSMAKTRELISLQTECNYSLDRRTLATKLQVKTMQALQVNDNAVRCR